VEQIMGYLATKALHPRPTVLAGDLNIERGSVEDHTLFDGVLEHSYLLSKPTATNVLRDKGWYQLKDENVEPDEIIDYVSLFNDSVPGCAYARLESADLIESFGKGHNTTATALSDHGSVGARLILGCS
jgi:hypothetical protein